MIVFNKMSPHAYIADELVNKVHKLHFALNQANDIIQKLEQENKRLHDVLVGLAPINYDESNLFNQEFEHSVCW